MQQGWRSWQGWTPAVDMARLLGYQPKTTATNKQSANATMAGIGEAASILQLAALSFDLAQKAGKTLQAYYAADNELASLRHRVKTTEVHLRNYQHALFTRYPASLHPDVEKSLKWALFEAKTGLEELVSFTAGLRGDQKVQGRVKWVCKWKRQATLLESRLDRSMNELAFAMQPVEMITKSIMLSQNELTALAINAIAQDTGNTNDVVVGLSNRIDDFLTQNPSNFPPCSGQTYVQCVSSYKPVTKARPARQLALAPGQLGPAWAMLGVSGNSIVTSQPHSKDWHVSFTVFASLTRLLSGHALHVVIDLRQLQASPLSFQFLGSTRFDVCRTVRSDNGFMNACQRGDLNDVRTKLSSGEGRISDRDEKNWTPLAHAIASGNTGVVEEILDRHADIEGKIGVSETSPLQWAVWHKHLDVTRLLLARKASQDHINSRGWNTVFFCWSWVRPGEPEMLGFLNLLAENDEIDLDVADLQNWTVLDRVAACGTANEVRRLIELGADPHQAAKPMYWTCLHQAVYRGNLETFLELLSNFEKASSMVDARGWTLMHIAASAGHFDIVEHLLLAGADPDARSYVVNDPELLARIPESIRNMPCTPQEAAAAQSSEREQLFITTLARYRTEKTKHKIYDNAEETFWMAQERLEGGQPMRV